MRVGQADIQVAVTCLCHPDNPAMLIRSVMSAIECPHCHAQYAINQATFDRLQYPEARVIVGRLSGHHITAPMGKVS